MSEQSNENTAPEARRLATKAELVECRKEFAALLLAWTDRGMAPAEAVAAAAGFAHQELAAMGFPVDAMVSAMVKAWDQ